MEHPIRALQTMLRAVSLCGGGALRVVPDGIYGAQTEASVRAFQLSRGLPATGIADRATFSALQRAYRRTREARPAPLRPLLRETIRAGAETPDVVLLQAGLQILAKNYRNFSAPAVTGRCGADTADAVCRLQRCCGLPETGETDRQTWQSLAALCRLTMLLAAQKK